MFKIGKIEVKDYPVLLAPMEDVSDPPFRFLCKKFGADIMYTEFISSEGLIRDAFKSVKKLDFIEEERPIGIQIFGHNIKSMIEATKYAEQSNPDLIDINFGCSVRKVVSKGAGAGILNDIPKMIKMTAEVVKSTKLPVTVKTRLGYDNNHKQIVEIAEHLQDVGIQALTIHGRTRTNSYKDKSDWTLIGEVKNNPRMIIPIIGNGDITCPEKAMEMKNKYNVDGIMIGRESVGNPWIFREVKHYLNTGELLPHPNISERIETCKIHLQKSIDWKGERTGILEMRKHYSKYFKGYKYFKRFKLKLMDKENAGELYKIFGEILKEYS